jgi:hypothetical protein
MAYASGWAWERVPARGFAKGAEMMTLKQVLGVVLLQLLVSLFQKVLLAERKYNVT